MKITFTVSFSPPASVMRSRFTALSSVPRNLANDAAGCLAAQLLAAKLNVKNGAAACIAPTIASADAFLSSSGYTGPNATYTLTAEQRAQAIELKDVLDTYNNGLGC